MSPSHHKHDLSGDGRLILQRHSPWVVTTGSSHLCPRSASFILPTFAIQKACDSGYSPALRPSHLPPLHCVFGPYPSHLVSPYYCYSTELATEVQRLAQGQTQGTAEPSGETGLQGLSALPTGLGIPKRVCLVIFRHRIPCLMGGHIPSHGTTCIWK